MVFANAPKTRIWDIAELLGGLNCSKSYFLGHSQMMLSEKSPKSLKLSDCYKLSLGLKLIWTFYLTSAREDLESISKLPNSTIH